MRPGRTNGAQRLLDRIKDTSTSNLEVITVARQKQFKLEASVVKKAISFLSYLYKVWAADKIDNELIPFNTYKALSQSDKLVPSKIFDPVQSDNNFLKIASPHENRWNSRIRSSMVSGSATTQQRTDELSAKLFARTTGTTGTGSECSSRSSARKAWRWESRWSERALVLQESEPQSAGRNLGLMFRYKPAPVDHIFTKFSLGRAVYGPREHWKCRARQNRLSSEQKGKNFMPDQMPDRFRARLVLQKGYQNRVQLSKQDLGLPQSKKIKDHRHCK